MGSLCGLLCLSICVIGELGVEHWIGKAKVLGSIPSWLTCFHTNCLLNSNGYWLPDLNIIIYEQSLLYFCAIFKNCV